MEIKIQIHLSDLPGTPSDQASDLGVKALSFPMYFLPLLFLFLLLSLSVQQSLTLLLQDQITTPTLPSAGPHLPKFLAHLKTEAPAGEQAFNTGALRLRVLYI